MNSRHFLPAALLIFGWLLSACPQATPSQAGNSDTASVSGAPQVFDALSDPHPIEPKSEPRPLGGDEKGVDGDAVEAEKEKRASMLGRGPVEVNPFVDARLRYGKDSKLLAKSPATPYVIHAKSSKITLLFSADLNWDPNSEDADWVPLTDLFDVKPQLRAVYVPPDPHQHVLYSDADWTVNPDGSAAYSLADLLVEDGGKLRFFMKDILEAETADFHSGGLVPLASDDPANPFPSDTGATIYHVGAFRIKAVIISDSPPLIRQSGGQSPPSNF